MVVFITNNLESLWCGWIRGGFPKSDCQGSALTAGHSALMYACVQGGRHKPASQSFFMTQLLFGWPQPRPIMTYHPCARHVTTCLHRGVSMSFSLAWSHFHKSRHSTVFMINIFDSRGISDIVRLVGIVCSISSCCHPPHFHNCCVMGLLAWFLAMAIAKVQMICTNDSWISWNTSGNIVMHTCISPSLFTWNIWNYLECHWGSLLCAKSRHKSNGNSMAFHQSNTRGFPCSTSMIQSTPRRTRSGPCEHQPGGGWRGRAIIQRVG